METTADDAGGQAPTGSAKRLRFLRITHFGERQPSRYDVTWAGLWTSPCREEPGILPAASTNTPGLWGSHTERGSSSSSQAFRGLHPSGTPCQNHLPQRLPGRDSQKPRKSVNVGCYFKPLSFWGNWLCIKDISSINSSFTIKTKKHMGTYIY